MPLGSILPESPHTRERGTKLSSAVFTAGMGLEYDATNGWKIGEVDSTAKAGVAPQAYGDGETDIDVITRGKVPVKLATNCNMNNYVKLAANGEFAEIGGADPQNMRKGFFTGQHDKPVDGNGNLQDPGIRKDGLAGDIVIIDLGVIS